MPRPEQPFVPDRAIETIADYLGDRVEPAVFPQQRLRWRNNHAAREIGLSNLADDQWLGHFGQFAPLPQAQPHPLALRYHGHQFRVYNPDLGDGRGFLFAQCRDAHGRLMDLGTKGSGTTPWSRFGDGRLTLKGAVREILATEMLEALGVPTSRTLSVIETGEALHRGDEPSPARSAVLVRLNHGHIRIGSFQRLATLGQTAELERLVAYSVRHYVGEAPGEDAALRLVRYAVARTARMVARFMVAGFVHGVLNTDNINITGESFDYGPWRFAPSFDPQLTAAYFDAASLYAFGRQAEAVHWSLAQLALALRPLAAIDALAAELAAFAPAYQTALIEALLERLGLVTRGIDDDVALVTAVQTALIETQAPLDQFFFDWRGGDCRGDGARYAGDGFAAFRDVVAPYEAVHGALDNAYWQRDAAGSMLIDEVEALWRSVAERDDWQPLMHKITDVRALAAAHRTADAACTSAQL